MKKILVVLVSLFILTSCAKKPVQETITINASEEAIAFREALYERVGTMGLTKEDQIANFENNWLPILATRTSQKFPEVEVKNTLQKEDFEGFDLYTFSGDKEDAIVLYIHGGAFVWEIESVHVTFCDRLVDELNAKVYIPIYPLAPEANFENAYQMLLDLYVELLQQNKPIYIIGDSAGGTYTLGLTLLIKDNKIKLPNKVVAMAPCADASLSNPDIDEYAKIDGMLCKYTIMEAIKLWTNGVEYTNYLLSPIYGDFTNFPDTLLFVDDDILNPDAVKMYQKMCEAGINVTLVEGIGLWHVFPVFEIPEKEQSLSIIKDFCAK